MLRLTATFLAVTYVAHVDDGTLLATRGGIVGEGVRRAGGGSVLEATAETRGATETTTEATAVATTGSEASAGAEATTTKATAESAAASTGASASKAVFTDLEGTALPLVAIKLRNCVASIIGRLESDDTGALGTTGGIGVHIGADDSTVVG